MHGTGVQSMQEAAYGAEYFTVEIVFIADTLKVADEALHYI